MASRDPQREQHWRSLLGEWQQSGQTVYAFCKHRDFRGRRKLEARHRPCGCDKRALHRSRQ